MRDDWEKCDLMVDVCRALQDEQTDQAEALLRQCYPFTSLIPHRRTYTILEATQLFVRDGFIDRYFGNRLIFTPVLRLVSHVLPAAFPFHPNWKMSACHSAYYALTPTIDHVQPIARGGRHDPTNWVTTSMLHNNAKANWTMGELGWSLQSEGDIQAWDGLLSWFIRYTTSHPELLTHAYFRRWYVAAKQVYAPSES